MVRWLASVAAVLTVGVSIGSGAFVVSGASGCAMSEPANLDPTIDPSLPQVDAASSANPAPGTMPGKDSGTPVPERGEEDASGSGTPDAGKDSATPPPVAPKPTAAEILISEIMYDSSGSEPQQEWIELYNVATTPRTLSGLTLKDGASRTALIGAGVTVAGQSYALLVRSKTGATGAKVPTGPVVYEYGVGLGDAQGILLTNGTTGSLALLDGATTLVQASYGSWFTQSGGSSVQLKVLDASQANLKASWCLSATAWTAGSEKGTPGAASDCP